MKKSYRAIFWDNDGILVDTEEIYFNVLAQVLEEHDYTLSKEEFLEISLKKGHSVFRTLLQRGTVKADFKTISDRRWVLYTEHLEKGIPLMKGVDETLKVLRNHVRMGVVTSTHANFFQLCHQNHPADFWEFILTAEDFTEFKPDPQPYLMALEKVNLQPEECLVVEDSPRGSLAAKRAGIDCAIIPTELTRNLDFDGATYRLETATQLLDIIDL